MNQYMRTNTSRGDNSVRQAVPLRLAGITLGIALLFGACAPTGSSSGGTGGSSSGGSGTGGTTTGSGGAGTVSGSGGAVESGSGGSQPVTTGGSTGSGGADPTGSGGAPATGGRAGTGGGTAGSAGATATGTGGTTGAGGGSSDDMAAAQVLNGYAILKPCVSSFKPTPNANGDCCCEELAANENQHVTKAFGGDPNVTYNVKVRIAGIAERYWYTGGTLDPVGMLFYTGGLPTIHSTKAPNNLAPGKGACKIHPPETDSNMALPFKVPVEVNPADGCFNGFNIFAMTVSAPKQSYFLNYTTDFDGTDRQPHKVYKNDYTVTIPIKGGASLDFYTIDGDHHQVTNDGTMSVPNVKTAQPYNGNFLEFTVLGVTR